MPPTAKSRFQPGLGPGLFPADPVTHAAEPNLETEAAPLAAARDTITHLLTEPPGNPHLPTLLHADWIETPIGPMLSITDPTHLHLLEFADRKALPTELKNLRASTRSTIAFARTPVHHGLVAELEAYFAGRSPTFRTPLALHGSAFTQSIWHHLCAIPAGTTESYSALARTAGQPSATRAVARANGANQLAILIPCHRVLGSDGALTGYAGGLWRKRWLLTHEQKHFSPPPTAPPR